MVLSWVSGKPTATAVAKPGGPDGLQRAIAVVRILRVNNCLGPAADTAWGLQSGEPVLRDSRCPYGSRLRVVGVHIRG